MTFFESGFFFSCAVLCCFSGDWGRGEGLRYLPQSAATANSEGVNVNATSLHLEVNRARSAMRVALSELVSNSRGTAGGSGKVKDEDEDTEEELDQRSLLPLPEHVHLRGFSPLQEEYEVSV